MINTKHRAPLDNSNLIHMHDYHLKSTHIVKKTATISVKCI